MTFDRFYTLWARPTIRDALYFEHVKNHAVDVTMAKKALMKVKDELVRHYHHATHPARFRALYGGGGVGDGDFGKLGKSFMEEDPPPPMVSLGGDGLIMEDRLDTPKTAEEESPPVEEEEQKEPSYEDAPAAISALKKEMKALAGEFKILKTGDPTRVKGNKQRLLDVKTELQEKKAKKLEWERLLDQGKARAVEIKALNTDYTALADKPWQENREHTSAEKETMKQMKAALDSHKAAKATKKRNTPAANTGLALGVAVARVVYPTQPSARITTQQPRFIRNPTQRIEDDDGLSDAESEDAVQKLIDSNMHAFSMLFEEYNVWWWEAFESVRRMLLTGFLVLCGPGSSAQIVVGIFITMFGLNAFIAYRPMVHTLDNMLSERAQWATLIVLVFTILLKVDRSTESEADQKMYGTVLILVGLSVPLTLVIYAITMQRGQASGSF